MLAIGNGRTTCECCGRTVNAATRVWLELDHRIDEYHDMELGVPQDRSQGWFLFGAACARKRLAAAKAAAKARGIYLGRRRLSGIRRIEMYAAFRQMDGEAT